LNLTSDNLSLSRYEHELGSSLDIVRMKSSDFATESTLDAREKGEDHTDVSTSFPDAGQAMEDVRDVNRSVELQEATYTRNVKSILSNINATEEEIISALEDEALARERKEAPGIVSLRERGCLPVESSPAVQDRATCPFRFITTFDKRRLPSLLVTVQCMCRGTPCGSRKGYRCVQISKPVSMMRRIGRIYSEMLEEVPLACVCAYVGPGVRNNFY
ncbi:unnamed protein product, partial [Ixodes persulcatus]